MKISLKNSLLSSFFIGLSFCFNSCVFQHLSVQTHYLSDENLASYYVYTPDPHLDNPVIGQQLLIQWALPASYLSYNDLSLQINIRLRNHEKKIISFPLTNKHGTYLYYIVNEDYCASGGIATYKVEVTGGGCLLETWKHPLWVELMTFNIPPEK